MTGPEHYTAAEEHAATAQEVLPASPETAAFHLGLAGVHATLAAAAALSGVDEMSYEDGRAWRRAAGITDAELSG